MQREPLDSLSTRRPTPGACTWILSVERESGDVLEIEDGYDESLFHDPEMDARWLIG